MHIKRHLIKTIGSWILLAIFMMACQPSQLPVILLIVPFILLFISFLSTWNLLGALRQHYGHAKTHKTHRSYLGIAVSGSLLLLLVLQSLGQLSLRDIVTVLAIVSIGYLYGTRNRGVIRRE